MANSARHNARLTLCAAIAAIGVWANAGAATAADALVFAAASLKNVVDDAAAGFRAETGREIATSYAGSAQLARQIENGAPADLYISANVDWVAYLAERGLVAAPSRRALAGNHLVFVAPPDAAPSPAGPREISADFDLSTYLDDGRMAVALVEAVPAGIYAKAALQSLSLWKEAAPRLAEVDNVRAALTLVSRGEAPLGVVYASDVVDASETRTVAVVGRFPASSHPPIVYEAAVVSDAAASETASAFLDYLASDAGRALFERWGFAQPPR